jgi:hypothetical protein
MMMKIRIHHFFDMIRDFGIGKEILPHPNLHSYHQVARIILENPGTELELVVGADAVCQNCIHLKNGVCTDSITHRSDFTEKEAFNNHLDRKSRRPAKSIFPKNIHRKSCLPLPAFIWIKWKRFMRETRTGIRSNEKRM